MVNLSISVIIRLTLNERDGHDEQGHRIVDDSSENEGSLSHLIETFYSKQKQQIVERPTKTDRLHHSRVIIRFKLIILMFSNHHKMRLWFLICHELAEGHEKIEATVPPLKEELQR